MNYSREYARGSRRKGLDSLIGVKMKDKIIYKFCPNCGRCFKLKDIYKGLLVDVWVFTDLIVNQFKTICKCGTAIKSHQVKVVGGS